MSEIFKQLLMDKRIYEYIKKYSNMDILSAYTYIFTPSYIKINIQIEDMNCYRYFGLQTVLNIEEPQTIDILPDIKLFNRKLKIDKL